MKFEKGQTVILNCRLVIDGIAFDAGSEGTVIADYADKCLVGLEADMMIIRTDILKKHLEVPVMEFKEKENSAIIPNHYYKQQADLFEAAFLTRPIEEFRALMEFTAERYLKRMKENRIQDLDKAIYTIQRLKEYEIRYLEENKNE